MPVEWTATGMVFMAARSKEEAVKLAQERIDALQLPRENTHGKGKMRIAEAAIKNSEGVEAFGETWGEPRLIF